MTDTRDPDCPDCDHPLAVHTTTTNDGFRAASAPTWTGVSAFSAAALLAWLVVVAMERDHVRNPAGGAARG